LERLAELVAWWSTNRQVSAMLGAVIGQKQADDTYQSESVQGQLAALEQALAKAEPLDELAKDLLAAATAAAGWAVINKEQNIRVAIAEALEPLKDMRLLIGAETASSIAGLSTRIKAILDRIHLRERLVYQQASLGKKEVNVGGSFEPGMHIDAAHVANTSWLRAILWRLFWHARADNRSLGGNPFPLMVLDDPNRLLTQETNGSGLRKLRVWQTQIGSRLSAYNFWLLLMNGSSTSAWWNTKSSSVNKA